jgi:hypothetical protein
MYELAEEVREAYALRDDPAQRARWMGFSRAYNILQNKIEAYQVEAIALGLAGPMFEDVPTFP